MAEQSARLTAQITGQMAEQSAQIAKLLDAVTMLVRRPEDPPVAALPPAPSSKAVEWPEAGPPVPADWLTMTEMGVLVTDRLRQMGRLPPRKTISAQAIGKEIDRLRLRHRTPQTYIQKPMLTPTKGGAMNTIYREWFCPAAVDEVAASIIGRFQPPPAAPKS